MCYFERSAYFVVTLSTRLCCKRGVFSSLYSSAVVIIWRKLNGDLTSAIAVWMVTLKYIIQRLKSWNYLVKHHRSTTQRPPQENTTQELLAIKLLHFELLWDFLYRQTNLEPPCTAEKLKTVWQYLKAHLHPKGLARRACCFMNFV